MEQQKKHTVEILIGVGYIILFCLVIATGTAFFAATISSQPPETINVIATNLPPRFPTPGFDAAVLGLQTFFEDDFSNNENNWRKPTDGTYIAEVRDGELFIQSNMNDSFLVAKCGDCPLMRDAYFLQADLRTTEATNQLFGVVFASSWFHTEIETCYVFTINTESKEYGLFHYKNESWSIRMLGVSDLIRSFPEKNKLSILANGDTVQFYINEEFLESYTQTAEKFHDGSFGFYVNSEDYELVVDDLVVKLLGDEQ